ncbi:MAG: toxic anion resistance protein [Atopobiaceae bacterium]|nr:toxic anion resistance protein [Atopobiaceae bacterium]
MAFDLEIPEPEEVKAKVEQELAVPEERAQVIDDVAQKKGAEILAVDLDSVASRREITHAVEDLGTDLVRKSSAKNDILARRMADLSRSGSESGEVARGLEDLAIKMRDLDPSGIDFMKHGAFGKLFNPVRRYFDRYKSADAEIAEIVASLDKGRDTLRKDNVTLELEAGSMRDLTKQLNQRVAMATDLDAYLSNAVDNYRAQGGDEDKIRFLEEEVIFPLRQKIMDFQQLLVVNQQGIVAMEVIRKNNLELIRAVDRAENVTVAALRTAVTVAGALYNQRIVLEKVQALNAATNDMIAATSRMLKEQGVAIQRQATDAAISPETLKAAFQDTLSALDDITEYKLKALPQMHQTIEEFRIIAEEGEARLQQMEDAGSFSLNPGPEPRYLNR